MVPAMSECTRHTAWNNILYTHKVYIVFVLFSIEHFNVLQIITFCFFLDFHTQSKPLLKGVITRMSRDIQKRERYTLVHNDYNNIKLNAVKKKKKKKARPVEINS